MKLNLIFALIASIICIGCIHKNNIKEITQAPNFTTQALFPDGSVKKISLEDYLGQNVVLYFYPKNGTPDCTKQAKIFRDSFKILQDHNIVVLGISYDSIKSHKLFQDKYQLPFILINDKNKKISKQYGSDGFLFPARKTILINEKGIVIHRFDQIDIKNQINDILQAFNIT